MSLNYNLILDKILLDLLPLTKIEIQKGNKIFGAIILNKEDYSTISVGTNNEIINPLYHGEISSINNFFSNKVNLNPRDYLFISSHYVYQPLLGVVLITLFFCFHMKIQKILSTYLMI